MEILESKRQRGRRAISSRVGAGDFGYGLLTERTMANETLQRCAMMHSTIWRKRDLPGNACRKPRRLF